MNPNDRIPLVSGTLGLSKEQLALFAIAWEDSGGMRIFRLLWNDVPITGIAEAVNLGILVYMKEGTIHAFRRQMGTTLLKRAFAQFPDYDPRSPKPPPLPAGFTLPWTSDQTLSLSVLNALKVWAYTTPVSSDPLMTTIRALLEHIDVLRRVLDLKALEPSASPDPQSQDLQPFDFLTDDRE